MSINLLDDDEVEFLFSTNKIQGGEITLASFMKEEPNDHEHVVGPIACVGSSENTKVVATSLDHTDGALSKVVESSASASPSISSVLTLPSVLAQLMADPTFVQLVSTEAASRGVVLASEGQVSPVAEVPLEEPTPQVILDQGEAAGGSDMPDTQGLDEVSPDKCAFVDDQGCEHVDDELPSAEVVCPVADLLATRECVWWDLYCEERDKAGEPISEEEFHEKWKKDHELQWEKVDEIARKGRRKGVKRRLPQGVVEHFEPQPFEQIHEHVVISVAPSNVGSEVGEQPVTDLMVVEPSRDRASGEAPTVSADVSKSVPVETKPSPVSRAERKPTSQLKVFTKLMNKVVKVKYKGDFDQFVYEVLRDPPVFASFMARVEYGALHNDRLEEALDISGGTEL